MDAVRRCCPACCWSTPWSGAEPRRHRHSNASCFPRAWATPRWSWACCCSAICPARCTRGRSMSLYDVLLAGLLVLVWRQAQRASARRRPRRTRPSQPDIAPNPAAYWLVAGLTAVAGDRRSAAPRATWATPSSTATRPARSVLRRRRHSGLRRRSLLAQEGSGRDSAAHRPTLHWPAVSPRAQRGLPFALAGLTALLAVYLLGRRMFGTLAGWAAAMLLAVDGYAVAFARIVQYQSLVLLTSALVVLILVPPGETPAARVGYLSLAATLAATGLLAHYEAALALIPALFLLVVATAPLTPQQRATLLRATGIAGGSAPVLTGALLRALCAASAVPRHLHLSGPTTPRHRRRGEAVTASPTTTWSTSSRARPFTTRPTIWCC